MGSSRSKGEVGDEEGVVVEDGKSGKEGVRSVEGSGGEEEFEGGRGGGDEGDGVVFVKTVITVFWL